jgi:hypothetical protein
MDQPASPILLKLPCGYETYAATAMPERPCELDTLEIETFSAAEKRGTKEAALFHRNACPKYRHIASSDASACSASISARLLTTSDHASKPSQGRKT